MDVSPTGLSEEADHAFSNLLEQADLCLLKRDMLRYAENCGIEFGGNYGELFRRLSHDFNEFLSIADYRLRETDFAKAYGVVFPTLPRAPGLSIMGPIGEGLFLQHGFGTRINVVSAGRELWVLHSVTIGHKGTGKPKLGDRVYVGTGAVIVGAIEIGDDVRIGANAVVDFDVPSGSRVYSPRSIIVRRDNE